MKEIINDIKGENFTAKEYVTYGIIAPIVGTLAIILGSMI